MTLKSHSVDDTPSDTLASQLLRLENLARLARIQAGQQYSRAMLTTASGVPEVKFIAWLTGAEVPAAPGADEGDLMTVVRVLALWAGQPQPQPEYWRALSAADRKRAAPADEGRMRWLRVPGGWIAGIVAAVIAGVLTPVLLTVVMPASSSGTPAAGGGRSPNATGTPKVPFGYTVSRTDGPANACMGWYFPRPIQKIPINGYVNASSAEDEEMWALRNGGSDINGGTYTITLQGNTATRNVAIKDIRVKVISKEPAQPGTVVSGEGCGGGLTVERFNVYVDEASPKFTPQSGATMWPYTISGTDIEYLLLDALLKGNSSPIQYKFVYQIDWAQGSRQGTVTVTAPNGKPFTAYKALPGTSTYFADNGHWIAG